MKRVLVYGMTSNRGGIESYLMTYDRVFSKKSNIVFDFVSEHKPIAYEDEIKSMGGRIFYIPSRREGLLKHMMAIRNVLKQNKDYSTIYFNILSASEVFTILSCAGVKGIKKIVHSHNNSVKTMKRHKMLRPLLNILADCKLACADEAAKFMFGTKNYLEDKVSVISNAIDVEKYAYNPEIETKVRKQFSIAEETLVIGHVGRMCYQKNSLFLVDLFYKMCKTNDNIILMYVGEGEDREQVEERIKNYCIEDKVLLLGMRNDVHELMQAMDVFLLPSRFEGLPIVLVEAQAAGLPCVCSDCFTKKSDITGNVEFVSLDEKMEYWVEILFKKCIEKKSDTIDKITDAGFNIYYEAEKLERFFEENN